jgi:tight adherence protein B
VTTVAVLVLTAVSLWPRRPRMTVGTSFPPRAGRGSPSRRSRRAPEDPIELVELVELVGIGLRAGLPPAQALRAAADASGSVGRDARETFDALVLDRTGEHPELSLVRGAWSLSERLGVPLAPAVDAATRAARSRADSRRRMQAELSGVTSSLWLLTAVPLAGPVVALLVGLDPVDLYVRSTAGGASAALGLVLTGLGWGVARLILRRSTRASRVR